VGTKSPSEPEGEFVSQEEGVRVCRRESLTSREKGMKSLKPFRGKNRNREGLRTKGALKNYKS